jgi:hypothetical protein
VIGRFLGLADGQRDGDQNMQKHDDLGPIEAPRGLAQSYRLKRWQGMSKLVDTCRLYRAALRICAHLADLDATTVE